MFRHLCLNNFGLVKWNKETTFINNNYSQRFSQLFSDNSQGLGKLNYNFWHNLGTICFVNKEDAKLNQFFFAKMIVILFLNLSHLPVSSNETDSELPLSVTTN